MGLEQDALADLNLRTTVGPYIGYQFYESRPLNLLAEFGVLWVDEDYVGAQDDRSWQPAWHIKFDKYIYKNALQFYHEHNGVATIGQSDNWFIR